MSLVPSVNGGTADFPYFHINRGAQADMNFTLPVIEGSSIGTIRLGDASGGMILRGDPLTGNASIRGGLAVGSSLTLGSSLAQPFQLEITDAAVTSNAPMIVLDPLTVTGNISTTGNLILGNNGGSISGYSQFITPAATYNDVTDTPLATPVGLTTGWYILSMAAPAGSQNEQQVSTIIHYTSSTGLYDIGGSILSATSGPGTFGFKPTVDRTQMQVHNATGFNQANITVYWVKLAN